MEELINALKTLLADTVVFKFRAQGYHWNVEGDDFPQFHSFFGEIYEDAEGSVDKIAEFIRQCGEYAPYRLERFMESRTISDNNVTSEEVAMASDLYMANQQLLTTLNSAFVAATAQNKQGIVNYLADRIDAHEKWAWQLRVIIKEEPPEL